jgi:O-antigen/teichoic acid export membrane protein
MTGVDRSQPASPADPRSPEELAQPDTASQERHLAAGAIAQQLTMAIGTLTMLGIVTIVGRTLSLSEFGVYGLLTSIPSYVIIAQASVEIAAVRAIAQAREQEERDRAVTTAAALYGIFGLVAGLTIVFGGWLLLGVLNISTALRGDARLGLLLLGLINVAGWPAKIAQDVLRGSQRFVAAAAAEALAYASFGVVMIVAIVLEGPLWVIAGLGGSLPLLIGLSAVAISYRLRLPHRLRPSTLSLGYTRTFLSASAYLLVTGVADLVIYSFDRAVLGAFRPVATVGLYEGPVRAHNLIRQLQGSLALTVMPAAAAYVTNDDRERLRALLVRGTRYVMLVTVPLTVTLMTLAHPILLVWLGPRFGPAATAMTILTSYWLIGAASGVGGAMLVAAGRVRIIAIFISAVAGFSLVLSLTLTPPLGLDGVVLGTSIPNAMMVPIIIWIYCQTFDVSASVLLREAFIPAYTAGLALACAEMAATRLLPLDRPIVLLSFIAAALCAYTTAIYTVWLVPAERALVGTLFDGLWERIKLVRRAYALR